MAPTMNAITPPINIQIALSVGEPVKNREMSELNEVDAIAPNAMRSIPAARRANDTALPMFCASIMSPGQKSLAIGKVLARLRDAGWVGAGHRLLQSLLQRTFCSMRGVLPFTLI